MKQGKGWLEGFARIVVASGVIALLAGAAGRPAYAETLPLDEFSPAFLGMYRKVMEVEDDIRRHASRYGVDFDLARAVCLYESGGNAGLASHAGAQGYFQVMPATFQELGVTTNIEAGVKYLAQMIQQFNREDRAVAAYNAGPGRVGRAGGLPLETLQYVIGVGHYRTVLKQYDQPIRKHASSLLLTTVRDGDDWSTLSHRLGISDWELRLHNPFLAGRRLRTGERIAYPPESRRNLFSPIDGGAAYRVRHGDNYIKLAIMLGVEIEALREENALWQTQIVPAGVVLRIPLSIDRANIIKAALMDHGLGPLIPMQSPLLKVENDSSEFSAEPTVAALIPLTATASPDVPARAKAARAAAQPRLSVASVARSAVTVMHRVARGDTLASLARRYGTTVSAIQQANRLRHTTILVGQTLRIPRARPHA